MQWYSTITLAHDVLELFPFNCRLNSISCLSEAKLCYLSSDWLETWQLCLLQLYRVQSERVVTLGLAVRVISLLSSFLAHPSTTCSRGAFRVVRCPSCVVNNFFKHLLLQNRWANLDQTWQECSLGGPLQKLFTEFDSIKNSGCHGNKIGFFKQFFKNLFLWNCLSDFEKISQECSLDDPFQNLYVKFWSAQKHGSGEWGLLAL